MTQHYLSRWFIAIGFLLACVPGFAQRRTISSYVMDAASMQGSFHAHFGGYGIVGGRIVDTLWYALPLSE